MEDIVDFLLKNPTCTSPSLTINGLSFGGTWSSWLANKQPEKINKVILFYATGWEPFNNIKASFLCHYADIDPYEGKNVNYFKEALQKFNIDATHYVYPNTHHWFFETNQPEYYNVESANLAWKRTIDFLQQYSNLA